MTPEDLSDARKLRALNGWMMRHFVRNVALACLLVLGLPRVALARSLDVTAVQIEATVKEDGSLAVVEQRTYDASGSYSGIFWDVHEGVYEGRRVEAEVTRVEAILGGQRTLLSEEETGANGTYELTDLGDYHQLKIFWPTKDETVTFLVGYTISGITSRWADTGELYWQYVPADPGSQGEWRNVTCTVELPVPDGAVVVPGDNVHAWGHGPIDGEVDFEGDAVRFFSPGVGADEFLEARIAFPAEWLDKQPAANEVRLDSILAEEDQWAKEANAQRWTARAVVFGIPGAMVLMGLGSVAVTFWTRRREAGGIFPKAQFSDKYFRDVPTDDHPAVLGMLYRNGALGTADYTATIMRLANQGRVLLDRVKTQQKGAFGRTNTSTQWRLLLRQDAQHATKSPEYRDIDDWGYQFLDAVADPRWHEEPMDPSLYGPNGELYLLPSFFDEVAAKWPRVYNNNYYFWSSSVEQAFRDRCFEVRRKDASSLPMTLGIASVVVAAVLAVVGAFNRVPVIPLVVCFVVCLISGIVCLFNYKDTYVSVYSQEAAEIRAKLEALKRWLSDFTRLEEAIPTDVILWNRLLVMASALGVAERVMEQLKVRLPQVVADPAFVAATWYAEGLGNDNVALPPAAFFERVIADGRSESLAKVQPAAPSYHETSTSSVASSRDSSSSGSGGGFSSGGGGGFSGGGGRGGGF